MAAKKVLVSWQSVGGPERSRVVTFTGGREELCSEITRKFGDVSRGEEILYLQVSFKVASSLFTSI